MFSHESDQSAGAFVTSFVAVGQEGAGRFRVKVNVMGGSTGPDPSTILEIGKLERKATQHENSTFAQVVADMKSITDTIVNEFEASAQDFVNSLVGATSSLSRHGLRGSHTSLAFLETYGSPGTLPNQVPVRVVANDVAYPTVSSLVQDMGVRRSVSEKLARMPVHEFDRPHLQLHFAHRSLSHKLFLHALRFTSISAWFIDVGKKPNAEDPCRFSEG